MADLKEMQLAIFLDQQAGNLANDLDWALARIDEMALKARPNKEHARSCIQARRHLTDRRAYENACKRSEDRK
jgi:hypothetical protein